MKWRKYFVLFGVFLLNVPNGVTWYYGNLSSYTACVFRKKQGSNIESSWLMSAEVACWTLGIILGGLLDSKLGPRSTMLLGAFLFNISFFLTFLTFELTFVTFILSLGVLTGIADGILHSASLSYIIMWVDDYVGLAVGLVTSSLGLGAVLINLIITRYINPLNLNPDVTDGNLRVFTQADILDRVPRVFLILGTFSSVFHFLGFVFLQSRRHHDKTVKCARAIYAARAPEGAAKHTARLSASQISVNCAGKLTNSLKEIEATLAGCKESDAVSPEISESDTARLLEQSCNLVGTNSCKSVKRERVQVCKLCCRKGLSEDARKDLLGFSNELQTMLKTKEFYLLVMLQFSMDYALVVVSHFYKLFGQTWLSDDQVLAVLGTVMTVTTIFPKLLLGALQDKIGLKETWIIMTSGTTITSAFWDFTPKVNKWMFFIWTVCITWFVCAFDSLVVAGVVEIYGTYRCNLKYGIVAAFSTVLQLTAPPIMSQILETFEWLGLFLSVSCLHCVSLIVSVLFLPRSGSVSKATSDQGENPKGELTSVPEGNCCDGAVKTIGDFRPLADKACCLPFPCNESDQSRGNTAQKLHSDSTYSSYNSELTHSLLNESAYFPPKEYADQVYESTRSPFRDQIIIQSVPTHEIHSSLNE
ncbi:agnestins efflux protein AgnL12 [Biomphalaria pfeifferi]|uniref:Agnestins efflux protein AgnL12 n=1 Tax=Biomphalaria pfeifferi TaxID=112525 RepID=A0AAD8BV66_BIOPF|nr:agnestins efflux protein AgnL12 [Biomphalaria pfeifferi]